MITSVFARFHFWTRAVRTKGNQCVGIAACRKATVKPVIAIVVKTAWFTAQDYTPISLTRDSLLYAERIRRYALAMSKKLHIHPAEERRASIVRSRKIAGQLAAIERMLGEDRDCSEILTQIVSARRGLKSLAEKLIHSHVNHCIEDAQNAADGKRKLRELLQVLERYVE